MEARWRRNHGIGTVPYAARAPYPAQEITQKARGARPRAFCDPGKEAYAFSMLMSLYSLSPISLAKLRTVPSS